MAAGYRSARGTGEPFFGTDSTWPGHLLEVEFFSLHSFPFVLVFTPGRCVGRRLQHREVVRGFHLLFARRAGHENPAAHSYLWRAVVKRQSAAEDGCDWRPGDGGLPEDEDAKRRALLARRFGRKGQTR